MIGRDVCIATVSFVVALATVAFGVANALTGGAS